jgi:hypothetical protein
MGHWVILSELVRVGLAAAPDAAMGVALLADEDPDPALPGRTPAGLLALTFRRAVKAEVEKSGHRAGEPWRRSQVTGWRRDFTRVDLREMSADPRFDDEFMYFIPGTVCQHCWGVMRH